jgi:hypothetical protein
MGHGKAARPAGELAIFFRTIAGCALVILVVLGVGGTIYKVIAPDGWLAQLFGRNFAGGLVATLAFLTIAAAAWIVRELVPPGTRNRFPELFVYTFAAAGCLYFMRFLFSGAL